MAYKITISPLARADIVQAADYIRNQGYPDLAAKWKRELLRAIKTLDEMPNRCATVDEMSHIAAKIRQLHHRSHRVIFRVGETPQIVEILRVYHSARAPLQLEDLTS